MNEQRIILYELKALTTWTNINEVFRTRDGKVKRFQSFFLELVNQIKRDKNRESVIRYRGNSMAVFACNHYDKRATERLVRKDWDINVSLKEKKAG